MKSTILSLIATTLTLSSSSAFAAGGMIYQCNPNDNGVRESVVISGSRLSVTSKDKMNGLEFGATYDPHYTPRGTAAKVRFLGKENGNGREVVLSKEMLAGGMKMKNGSRGGFMQIRGTEDGYWSQSYTCFLAQ